MSFDATNIFYFIDAFNLLLEKEKKTKSDE